MRAWWLQLTRYARPHARGLSAVIALMLLGTAFDVLKPWPMKLLVDYVLARRPVPRGAAWIAALPGGTESAGLLAWCAGGTLLLFLALRALGSIRGYIQSGVANGMTYELGAALFDHLQHLSLIFHSRRSVGDLVQRVSGDCGCVSTLVFAVYLPVTSCVASLVTMFAVMWRLDRPLSLLALLAAPPLGMLIRVFAQPMAERRYERRQLEGEMSALAEQTLTALPIVQAFGREEHGDRCFRTLSQRTVRAYLRATLVQLQLNVGTGAVTALGTAGLMAVGGLHVLKGTLSIGSLLVFLSYLSSLYDPLYTLAYISSEFASAAAGARRVMEIMEMEEGVRDAPGAQPLPAPRGHIRLEAVTFGYEPGRPVLHRLSLEAHPGETVALVGPTGAGKSTLVSLLPRFFDPWEGRVTFDGRDLRELQLASLRAQIALVLQEPLLLPLTVAENIAYGRPGASREQIEAAAVAANADGFIRRLPQGYETVIGERGGTLSGGERQRLSIARALLKDAPVLILDEPTSALDAQTEALLLEALERLMAGRTTFIIAHRLSTIRRADRIVVLEGGEIVEEGHHAELMAQCGLYASFYRQQLEQPHPLSSGLLVSRGGER
jgi:ATP-binding cassette, subfamily B, bacterial